MLGAHPSPPLGPVFPALFPIILLFIIIPPGGKLVFVYGIILTLFLPKQVLGDGFLLNLISLLHFGGIL